MTPERKAYFIAQVKKIGLDLVGLAMEFPDSSIHITADDRGYISASVADESTIYMAYKYPGKPMKFEEYEREEVDEWLHKKD